MTDEREDLEEKKGKVRKVWRRKEEKEQGKNSREVCCENGGMRMVKGREDREVREGRKRTMKEREESG